MCLHSCSGSACGACKLQGHTVAYLLAIHAPVHIQARVHTHAGTHACSLRIPTRRQRLRAAHFCALQRPGRGRYPWHHDPAGGHAAAQLHLARHQPSGACILRGTSRILAVHAPCRAPAASNRAPAHWCTRLPGHQLRLPGHQPTGVRISPCTSPLVYASYRAPAHWCTHLTGHQLRLPGHQPTGVRISPGTSPPVYAS